MESMELGKAEENSKAVKTISVSRRVQNAIRQCQGNKGVSFQDLKKFLRDSKKLDVAVHAAEIKMALKNSMDRGVLTKEDGLYKVKTAARRRRSRSPSKGRKTKRGRSKSRGRKSSKRRKSPKRKGTGRKRSRSKRRKSPKRKGTGKKRSRSRSRRRKPADVAVTVVVEE